MIIIIIIIEADESFWGGGVILNHLSIGEYIQKVPSSFTGIYRVVARRVCVTS